MPRRDTEFQAIRSEGGLLPSDLLRRIVDPASKVPGVEPAAYGLPAGERINEAITQSWNRLRRHWAEFRALVPASGEPRGASSRADLALPHSSTPARPSPGAEGAHTGLTNDKWSLPLLRELGFGFLPTTPAPTLDGKSYAIRRFAGSTPIHLVGCSVSLDRRSAGVRGAAAANPHGLVQEFLNRSPDHLWAIVSNGLSLRILRDNQALSRQSFLEFDLQAMFDGEVYPDFVLLWLVAHASRFLPRHDGRPDSCWLEQWSKEAADQGVAALTDLRGGVEKALVVLGQGFVSHPRNSALRDALRSGQVKLSDFHHQLLRVVYRLIFLFVSEDRDLEGVPILHPQDPSEAARLARDRYAAHYGTGRLRDLASRIKGSRHGDLWRQFQLLVGALSGDARFAPMRNALALPSLGSMLWNPDATALLNGPGLADPGTELSNHDFLEALRHLAFIRKDKVLRPVDYKNLGSEEFGGVYESFLALTPQVSSDGARFTFAEFAGNERKTSGSYYTPDSLVQCLLDSALDPVVEARLADAARMASGEWRMVTGPCRTAFLKYANQRRSRSGSLAAGALPGQSGLSAHPQVSHGGTLRHDLVNPSGINLDAGQHSGGMESPLSGGVHPVSSEGKREPDGTGNPSDRECGRGTLPGGSHPAAASGNDGSGQTTTGVGAKSPTEAELEALWKSTPLAIRHSLFAETALLSLKACDMACGSGHFLVGAGHRLARHLARVRALAEGESEPSPLLYQTALRDVIGHCLYGVDINPMAVELCKVTLWLEALEPGKPLSFLDHHIRCGNSLLGATPELIAAGLPDEAFDPIEGDDKAACSSLKKLNRAQREGLRHLFIAEDNALRDRLRQTAAAIDDIADDQPEDIQRKETAFHAVQSNYDFRKAWHLANLWCAAFVIQKRLDHPHGLQATTSPSQGVAAAEQPMATQAGLFGDAEDLPKTKAKKPKAPRRTNSHHAIGITTQHLRDLVENGTLPEGLLPEASQLAQQYQFFHWHLAFPEVFAQGGFDVGLGNPPWEQAELEETEWFSMRRPEIALAHNDSERNKLIARLKLEAQELHQAFLKTKRKFEGTTHFARRSGLYPFCGKGRINTASLFAELSCTLCRSVGRVGCIVPTGIATDETTKDFFNDLLRTNRLTSLFGFHNGNGLFPEVRPHQQFCLLTIAENHSQAPAFAFSLSEVSELMDASRQFFLTLNDIELVNPNTRTCPIFPNKRHMELTKAIYQTVPVLFREADEPSNSWGTYFKQGLFNMATDSGLFRTKSQLEADGWVLNTNGKIFARDGEEYVPLYDAKMVQQYNHRAAELGFSGHQFRKISKEGTSLEQLIDPTFSPLPIYWVSKSAVTESLRGWHRRWLLGFKDVTGTTSTSLGVFTVIPLSGVGHKLPLIFSNAQAEAQALLLANLNSLITEYVLRLKFQGLSLSFYYLKQLPILPPETYAQPCAWMGQGQALQAWLLLRVIELTYTAWDLEPFARDCGFNGPPFRWDEERRFVLRCELDAAFFHLYLGSEEEWRQQPAALTQSFPTPRDAVSYIMDTFPIVRRKDEERFDGDYRTKRTILEIYDALAEAIKTGQPYPSRLNPPPADPRCCHPPRVHDAPR